MPARNFGARLSEATAERGPLCVGIDPHPFLLEQWGLPDTAAGAREFGLRVVDAAVDRIAVLKPQIAFFERHGAQGYAALESVLSAARAANLLVIADVKRGDVGSTLDAYAQAWLTPGSPLEADAMTVNPFQGVGSLTGAAALANAHAKGLFVLAATSNPEAAGIQMATEDRAHRERRTVAAGIVEDVVDLNRANGGTFGSFGVVLGATIRMGDYGISRDAFETAPVTPILAPGFGHQGASFADVHRIFGSKARVIAAASRSVLSAGPAGVRDSIDRAVKELSECLE